MFVLRVLDFDGRSGILAFVRLVDAKRWFAAYRRHTCRGAFRSTALFEVPGHDPRSALEAVSRRSGPGVIRLDYAQPQAAPYTWPNEERRL